MDHVLVAESRLEGIQHIQNMEGFFFKRYPEMSLTANNKISVVLPSGRVDNIYIITHEQHYVGHSFDGTVFRTTNAGVLDRLYYWCLQSSRSNQFINKLKDDPDEQTLQWNWSKANSRYNTSPDDHPIARTIVDGLEAEKWSRDRG